MVMLRFFLDFVAPLLVLAVVVILVDRQQDTHLVEYVTADRERLAAFVGGTLVVCVATASTYAFGSPPPLEGRYDTNLFHVALIVLVVGVFMTVHGLRHYDTATILRAAVAAEPSDLPADGSVAVTGTAQSVGAGTVTAPHSGETALVAEAGRFAGGEKYAGAADGSRAQQLLGVERVGTPFDVTDEYGSVRVDPGDASLAFLVGSVDGGTIERRVEPGDEVTVVGHVDGARSLDPVVVAAAENDNLGRFASNIPRVLVLGPFVSLVGYGGMVLTAGVV